MRRNGAAWVFATALASAAWASPARAGNEAHVRTPVLWPSDCAVIVERQTDPMVHFDYAIPVEDTQLTPEELADSRTHQFIALSRDRALSELLPTWVTRDDAQRSAAAGLIDDADPTSAAILDESPAWSGGFERITADDERRPITFESAALGVDWDTTGVDVGVWSVVGYTFEPPFNLWRDRPGFVKVVDDRSDPEQDLPALALLGEEQALEPGARIELEACADVLEPATLELEWAPFAPQLEWRSLATTSVTSDGPVQLEVRVPAYDDENQADEGEVLIRGRLIDARGRERIAYLPVRVLVLPCPSDGCNEIPSDVTPPVSDCACTSTPRPPPFGLLLWPLVLLGRRRRYAVLRKIASLKILLRSR